MVSTTPAEVQTDDLVRRCAQVPVVFEALYEPWPTSLARSAHDRVLVSGLDLLVHQAVLQFELFTVRGAKSNPPRPIRRPGSRTDRNQQLAGVVIDLEGAGADPVISMVAFRASPGTMVEEIERARAAARR